MTSTLMNTVSSNRANSAYFMTVPSSNEKTSIEKPVSAKENPKADNRNLLLAGLGGLAVIGLSVLTVKKVKGAKLRQEISNVSAEIRERYLAAKKIMLAEFNKPENLPDSFKTDEFAELYINSSKDIRKVKAFYQDKYNQLTEVQQASTTTVRNSLKSLSKDEEWKNLRTFRKQLVKDINGKDIAKHDVAVKKISLVNDMLVYKLHPEKEHEFQVRNLISIDDARYLINKQFANAAEYDAEYQKCIKFGFEYLPMDKFFVNNSQLSLLDLFKEESITYEQIGKRAKLVKQILDEDVVKVQESFSAKLRELGETFKADETIKNLRKIKSS